MFSTYRITRRLMRQLRRRTLARSQGLVPCGKLRSRPGSAFKVRTTMTSIPNRWAARIVATLLQFALLASSLPAQQQPAEYTFRVQTDLVLVNVTVRDKNGNFVRGLKPGDFTILEDNKPQKVVSFDVEDIDAIANQNVAQTKPLSSPLAQ